MLSSTLIDDNELESSSWNLENAPAPPEDDPTGYVRFCSDGGNSPPSIVIAGSHTNSIGRNSFGTQSQQRRIMGESTFTPVMDRLYRLAGADLLGSSSSSPTKHHRAQQDCDDQCSKHMQPLGLSSPPPTPLQSEGKATFSQCIFNMANILMGVGLLGLPFVFMSAGWLGGSFILFLFGFVTWKSSILIGKALNGDPRNSFDFADSPYMSKLAPGSVPEARQRKPLRSFPEIAHEAFGNVGCIVLSTILYFELFSCLCIFLVIMGDHLHSLWPSVSTSQHTIFVAAASMLPTVLLRTPRQLSYLSIIGAFATVAVVGAVCSDSFLEGDITEQTAKAKGMSVQRGEPHHVLWRWGGVPIALGISAFCFSGHAVVPSIFSTMKYPQDFDQMITAIYPVVIGCSFAVAVSGYYMFGYAVEDQITLSLAQDSTNSENALWMRCLIWLMILTCFSKLSLTMFPLALGLEEMCIPYIASEHGLRAASCLIKVAITLLALMVANYFPSFSLLCAFVGLLCTLAVSVVFPAAAHLKLFYSSLTSAEKILDWFFIVFGCIAAVVGTMATVYECFGDSSFADQQWCQSLNAKLLRV